MQVLDADWYSRQLVDRNMQEERSRVTDGPYSWLVLFVIILSNTVCMGQLFGAAGVRNSDYEQVLGISYVNASLVGSVAIGVFLFSGMQNTDRMFVQHRSLSY